MPKRRKFFAGTHPEKGKSMESKDGIYEIDLEFLRLIKNRKYAKAIEIIDQVQDINVRDQRTRNTPLHYAALYNVFGLAEELDKRADLDYLVKNINNNYPSQLAWEVSGHEELGAKMMVKEKEQGLRNNIQVWPKLELPEF